MLRVGCHVRRARALAAGEGRAATDSVGSVRRVRGAPSAARGIAGGPPRWRRSCLYAQATLPGRKIDVAGTSKRPRGGCGRAEAGQAVAHSHAEGRRSGGGASNTLPWPPNCGF